MIIMKRALFLIFFISLSSLVCKGQEYPDIYFQDVESSKDYVNGNEFQKDLLLYSKTWLTCKVPCLSYPKIL